MLLFKKKRNVHFFQFPELNRFSGITHGIGCRLDGRSHPPYDSMNVSYGVGDNPDHVAANRIRWHKATGGVVHMYTRQNHGTSIRVITRERLSEGKVIQVESKPADALITNVPQIRLLIQTADCQAVLLYDPQKKVVANIHCGWRGSVINIIEQVISRMSSDFDCDPQKMTAAIGPSLGPCCAEFINYENEIPRHLWKDRIGSNHFDFWRISRHQLVNAGLASHRIHTANVCTRCNSHLFFSYRDARQTGRFATLIGLEGR